MAELTLNFPSKISLSQVITANDLRERYLFGIQLQQNGQPLHDNVFDNFIEVATQELEKYLAIKIPLQVFKESKHYSYDDWLSWGYIKTSYWILHPVALDGFIGTVRQVHYPQEWLSVRKTSDHTTLSRNMYIVPNANTTYQQAIAYTGVLPNTGGWRGANGTPNYWNMEYVTGFVVVPKDIENVIAMLASVNLLIASNESMASALGALGTSSKSISLDGLSQSISMYVNGQTGIFGARISQYLGMLTGQGGNQGLLDRLRDYYGSLIIAVA